MNHERRNALVVAVAITLGGATLAASSVHANNVAWGVSVGGPGFAVSAGYPGLRAPWRPVFVPVVRPFAPVVIRPVVFRPVIVARSGWAHRVAVQPGPGYFVPRPVSAPQFVVVPRPFVATASFSTNHSAW